MDAAIVTAVAGLLIFLLGKLPAATREARNFHRLKRELEVYALMPDGAVKDRLAASVEKHLSEILDRRPAEAPMREVSRPGGEAEAFERLTAWVALALMLFAVSLAVLVLSGVGMAPKVAVLIAIATAGLVGLAVSVTAVVLDRRARRGQIEPRAKRNDADI